MQLINGQPSSHSRRSIVVVENFYEDPVAIREYALAQDFYTPYEDEEEVRSGRQAATWWATRFKPAESCAFKSSATIVAALSDAVGECVDMDHWRGAFPAGFWSRPLQSGAGVTCLWNCCFHVKPETGQRLGNGVHNHVVDSWNSVGLQGWAGLIYLSPTAPITGGLHLWRNHDPSHQLDWMTPAPNWELVDSLGNVFNRLILVRGDIPHSGSDGWGKRLDEGRLYQTFFFRTIRTGARET